MFNAHIIHALFIDLSSAVNGGAINYQNSGIEIFCNKFSNCQAQTYGGAIYLSNAANNISNNLFESCFVRERDNEKYGNVIYAPNCATRYEMNTMYKCGPDSDHCGDSACVLTNQVYIVKNLNASKIFGWGGAGSVALFSPSAGTAVSYIQCNDITDNNFFELWKQSNSISKCNFMNKTKGNYLFWIEDATLTAIECCFVNTPSTLVNGGGNIRFNNCQSDVTYAEHGISSFKNLVSINVMVCSHEIVKCETNQNIMNYSIFNFSMFFYILSII